MNGPIIKMYLLLMFCAVSSAVAAAEPDHTPMQLCAQTADGKIRLVMDTEGQTVRYAGQSQTIPIVFHSQKMTNTVSGRPSEFEYRWLERYRGKITGEYRYRLMGANFYRFRYLSHRNGKTVDFDHLATQPDPTAGCGY